MEILFVSHKFPPSTGGMEKQCYELARGMEKKCKVHYLVFDNKGSKVAFFLMLGRKIRKICRENSSINIIYLNDALIASYCSFLNLPKYISYVVTLHGLDIVFPSHIYHKYILPRLNHYHRLIAVSNATAHKAIELGLQPNKITVIPNGVDSSDIQEISGDTFNNWLYKRGIDLSDRKLLMLLGRPVKRKGFSWFAEHVFPLLNEDLFFLIIVGPFHEKATLYEKIIYILPSTFRNKLMLFLGYFSDERPLRKVIYGHKNIKHLGKLSYSEIQMLFNKSNAFLMPNIPVEGDLEGFGLVCLEASINKALVLASNIDGIPDAVINRKNGILLPSNDPTVWIEQLNSIAQECEYFDQYRSEFSTFTKINYSWKGMVNDYHDIFLGLSSDIE